MTTVHLTERTQAGGGTPLLAQDSAPRPQPGSGELLIAVHAAGLMQSELSWYPTSHDKAGRARKAAVPGHEFSGTVAAVGGDVGSLEVGREVYGMNDWYADGAMAEYCVAPFFAVAPKPRWFTHVEAASVPIGALTAWQGLFVRARLQPGERVLVHGGAGAVGVFAIQLARLHGAHVCTTASAGNRDFVSSLGAEQVVDYRQSRFEDCVQAVDVVFDTAGGETLRRSWSVLKPGGRLVTIASSEQNSPDPRTKRSFFIVEPDQKQLVEVGNLLDAGKLRPVVDSVLPLAEAPAAYSGKVPRHGRGKLVIEMPSNI